MRFIFIPVLFAISFDRVVSVNTIKGGNMTSNATDIYEYIFYNGIKAEGYDDWKMMYPFKINGVYVPYMIPNLTIYRRIFNIGLEFIRKLFRGDVKMEPKPNATGSDVYPSGKTKIKEKTPTRRTSHEEKIIEIANFCKDKYLTTDYLYEEVQRIKVQRIVKDDLRNMVTILDDPKNVHMRTKVLRLYMRLVAIEKMKQKKGIDDYETNKLIANLMHP